MKGQSRALRSRRVELECSQLRKYDSGSIFSFRRDAPGDRDLFYLKNYQLCMHLHLPNFRPLRLPSLKPTPAGGPPELSQERSRSSSKKPQSRARYKTEELYVPPPPKDYSKYNQISFREQQQPPQKVRQTAALERDAPPFDMAALVEAQILEGVLQESRDTNRKLRRVVMMEPQHVNEQRSSREHGNKVREVQPGRERSYFTHANTSRASVEQIPLTIDKTLRMRQPKRKRVELSPWEHPSDQQSIF